MIDASHLQVRIGKAKKGQETRSNALANEACDSLEPLAYREKVRPQYLRLYKKACQFNLEGELKEILERTQMLYAQGRVQNRGQYFLTAARSLLK